MALSPVIFNLVTFIQNDTQPFGARQRFEYVLELSSQSAVGRDDHVVRVQLCTRPCLGAAVVHLHLHIDARVHMLLELGAPVADETGRTNNQGWTCPIRLMMLGTWCSRRTDAVEENFNEMFKPLIAMSSFICHSLDEYVDETQNPSIISLTLII